MRIALYVSSWPPGFSANGIVTYAAELVPALRRLGHEVFVLTQERATNEEDPWTIDLQRYLSKARFSDRILFRLAPATARFRMLSSAIAAAILNLVKQNEIDVVEMEESFGWNFAVSRLKAVPVVVRLHGPWFVAGKFGDPEYGSILNRRREKREGRGIKYAHFVTSPSAEVLRAAKNHYHLPLTASTVIHNPIHAATEKDLWRIGTSDKNNLLFVGRFDQRKGADLVLQAFAKLAERYRNLTLTFIGPDRGIHETGGKLYFFDEFVRAKVPESIRARINFLGSVSHSKTMALRAQSFATISAARYEIFPYSVLEAMSLGCPLVATAVGGVPEIITDRRNGLLVASEDVSAIVGACAELLDDPGLATRLGQQAWRDCMNLYTPDKIARETIAVYEQAIIQYRG